MRKSLFDNYAPKTARPARLQPNIFARLASSSYNNAGLVIFLWCAIALASALWCALQSNRTSIAPLDFSRNSAAQKYVSALDQNFPNLNSLIAINMINADPQKLILAREKLLDSIEAQTDNFELVFAPGTGDYYESHGILYHSLEDVKARVAYAKSLKPLFTAIATAPTTESLAILVNEVSASILLGRDPQGLDELFSQSAKSVQALMSQTERLVNWTAVAGLNVEPLPTSVLVFALPKSGKSIQALASVKDLIAQLDVNDGTTTLADQSSQIAKKSDTDTPSRNLWPALAMATIFVGFALVAMLGQLTLITLVALPTILIAMIVAGPFRYFVFAPAFQFWPMLLSLLILMVQMSARLSFISVESLNIARGKESAVMLSSQKQGRGLTLLVLANMMLWASWFALNQTTYNLPVLIIIVAMAFGLLATLTLIPALIGLLPGGAIWNAGEWLTPLHESVFNNRAWRLLRNALTLFVIIAACAGFWLAPNLLQNVPSEPPTEAAVNILADSTSEAEAIVKTLKSVPEAQSVRWLGGFLPQQVDEKQAVLQELKDQFPRITPLIPQSPEVLREHISTLQESLQAIANSSATRKELRDAAHEFRRSLELLAATSSNREVMALENRIFGSFNVLADRAENMAGLDKPSLQTLDPRLKSLFLSEQNIFRLEVTPVTGLANQDLARVLAGQGFHVAHPVLVADEKTKSQQQAIYIVLGAALATGLAALIFVTLDFSAFLSSLFTLAIFVGCAALGIYYLQLLVSPMFLLAAIAVAAFMVSLLALAFLKKQLTNSAFSNSFYAVEAWLPFVLLLALLCPFVLLSLPIEAMKLGAFAAAVALALVVTASVLRPLMHILHGD